MVKLPPRDLRASSNPNHIHSIRMAAPCMAIDNEDPSPCYLKHGVDCVPVSIPVTVTRTRTRTTHVDARTR